MNIEKHVFGSVDAKTVYLFSLKNKSGMEVDILTYGGIIHGLRVKDKSGELHECVQNYENLDGYVQDQSYRGALVGRFANRIGNATFNLDGKQYLLDKNGGEHSLHGGNTGFHKCHWQAEEVHKTDGSAIGVRLTLTSPDGEGGFPGTVDVVATYWLDSLNQLTLTLTASTDKSTPFSMTQHAYFTLSKAASVVDTALMINAASVLDADTSLLPTGHFVEVEGTPFDFTSEVSIGKNAALSHPLFDAVGGYDHNFVLNSTIDEKPAAKLHAPDTGIDMLLFTDLPGIQCYTGNLQHQTQLGAVCLEPQHFPDAPNKPDFPSSVITPGAPYNATIKYKFTAK